MMLAKYVAGTKVGRSGTLTMVHGLQQVFDVAILHAWVTYQLRVITLECSHDCNCYHGQVYTAWYI